MPKTFLLGINDEDLREGYVIQIAHAGHHVEIGVSASESTLAEARARGIPVVRKPFTLDHLL